MAGNLRNELNKVFWNLFLLSCQNFLNDGESGDRSEGKKILWKSIFQVFHLKILVEQIPENFLWNWRVEVEDI